MNNNQEDISPEMLQKYVETIRHFRGYVDKERFNEDVEYLRNFLNEVGTYITDMLKAA